MQLIAQLGHTLYSTCKSLLWKRDSELEQASIRVFIGLFALVYFSRAPFPTNTDSLGIHLDPICVLMSFVVISAMLSLSVWIWPGDKPSRRIMAILLDVGTLTYLFIIAESRAAPLFFLYQWIIIGYGFRFGTQYLFISLGMALLGFGVVIALVPYWYEELGLSAGLWLGTLLISLYFSTFVSRLRNALSRAKEANQAKRIFICSVSHELRTPLNAIIGMVDLLNSTTLDREQKEILTSMTNTSKVMLSQIEDVLDFSKIEAGKMSVEYISFDLCQLVRGIHDIFSYQIDPFQIALSHSIAEDVPYWLRGDPHHLRQILVNLIGNSVKFTEQGSISLRIKKIESAGSSIRLHFMIKDTGIGISESAKAKIFDSFTQADESTARRFGGTGLGTTICKQLVELMGGAIGFSSTQGKGSTFWFELEFFEGESPALRATDSFEAIRALIISPLEAQQPLVDCLVDLCGRAPALARNTSSAIALMEQALMTGQPIRLIFLELPLKDAQSVQDYVAEIRKQVDLLCNLSMQVKVTFILLNADRDLLVELDPLMDVAGLYSVLGLPPVPEFLLNLLHAHLTDLDRSHLTTNAKESQTMPALESGPLIAASEHHGYEILVAEDNPTNRKVLQKILERAGHRCVLVKDGEEALDVVDKRAFDAIVLDMNMPLIAGTDVARLCRLMQGQSARIPIIMFSANVTPEAKMESMQAGADEFLPKPIQVDTFLRTLDRLVENFHHSVPGLRKQRVTSPSRPVLLIEEEPVLNPVALEGIEKMSHDPKFLDDLLVEFIRDNKQLLDFLEQAMLAQTWERFWEIVHALKGSALSVGATSMKMACRRLEKLDPVVIALYSHEINVQLRKIFTMLCEELENYRLHRIQRLHD